MKISAKSNPYVSILLLTYNQQEYVKDALLSAIDQDYNNYEIIVSDDCSLDQTSFILKEIAEKYSKSKEITIVEAFENSGLASNLNRAMTAAKGLIFVIAAGDDIMYRNKVSSLVNQFIISSNISLVHSGLTLIDLKGNIIGERIREEKSMLSQYDIVKNGYKVVSQSCAFKREIFDFFGPFEVFMTNESLPFAFRAAYFGSIFYLKEQLTYYRIGSGVSSVKAETPHQKYITEPEKKLTWQLTAYQQLRKDITKQNYIDPSLYKIIKNKEFYFYSLIKITQKNNIIKSIYFLFMIGKPFDGLRRLINMMILYPISIRKNI